MKILYNLRIATFKILFKQREFNYLQFRRGYTDNGSMTRAVLFTPVDYPTKNLVEEDGEL